MAAVIIAFILAYLIGSFPTSFIMGKALKGIDIRQVGSGNAGATNVMRTMGKVPGLVTLVIDILKGSLVVFVVANLIYPYVQGITLGLFRVLLGFIVICGHIWPVFLGFRGGKGVATTIGVVAALEPTVLLWGLLVWVAVFSMTNYVSLSSITMGLTFPIVSLILHQPVYNLIFFITICAINSYKHKGNIERLVRGVESKTIIFKRS
ncbi:MAG: glycerol-3-phosphate 1-O-acyltransferase PlsY [Candidatus Omnitrophica bacterium]|nr:glycerol-3-phosphate 1-O-acyltransferase PlsY [Candidatus Omnitrophota bacterium]